MSNELFKEYSTSVAFQVTLSKLQCNALLRAAASDPPTGGLDGRTTQQLWPVSVGTLRTLEARGFVFWHKDSAGQRNGFGGLTNAGRLMVGLLEEAGMTIENTNTLSILKRVA